MSRRDLLRMYLAATMAAGVVVALLDDCGPVDFAATVLAAPVMVPASIAYELAVTAFER